MHVVGVRLFNWCRFRGEHEISLGSGVHAIVARDVSDPRLSNWRGKSSLLAALRWAIFGSKVLEVDRLDELISHGEDEMFVELEFDDGAFVSRKRRRGQDKRDLVFERGSEKSSGVGADESIRRAIGFEEEDLLSTAFAEQGEISSVAREKGSATTATFSSWLRLEALDRAIDFAEDRASSARINLDDAVRKSEELRDLANDERIAGLEFEIEDLESEDSKIALAEKAHIVNVKLWERRIHLGSLLAREEAVREAIDGLEESNAGVPGDDEIERIKRERDAARDEFNEGERSLSRLKVLSKGGFDGECPIDSTFECPLKNEINSRARENEKKRVEEQALHRARFEKASAANKALAAVEAMVREKTLRAGKRSELEKMRSLIAKEIETLVREGVRKIEEGEREPESALGRKTVEIAIKRQELEKRKLARKELVEAEKRIAAAKRHVEIGLTSAMVLEGTRTKLFEGAVRAVRDSANAALSAAGVELSVADQWERATGALATSCRECGAAFAKSARERACLSCGAVRGFKGKPEFRWRLSDRSGAARDLAGLALRCGAFSVLKSLRSAELSIGIFDEPLSQLDEAHREAVARHLQRMLGSTFKQVFVADHHMGFMDSVPKKILITSEGRWNRLEVVG